MIDVTVVLKSKNPDDVSELRKLLAEHVNLSRQEPGCIRFEAYESQTAPNTFVLIERWESQASLDVHRTAQGFTTIYAPRVIPMVERTAHLCTVLPGT